MTRSRLLLVGWLSILVATVAVLTPMASVPALGDVTDETAAADAVVDVVALLTLAVAWYLLVATAVTLLAHVAAPLQGLARALTVSPVRRLVTAAFGVSLAAAAITSTGIATTAVRPTTAVAAEAETSPETMRRLPEEPHDLVMRRLPDAPAVPTEWHVQPGDHLWSVAETVLERAWGRPASDAQIDPYWRSLVELNRGRLADSSNPDLVYPGQVLTVPPPPPAGSA